MGALPSAPRPGHAQLCISHNPQNRLQFSEKTQLLFYMKTLIMFFAAILFVGVAICPHIAFSHPSEAIHDPGDEETQGVNFDELDPSFNLTDWLSSYQDTRRHDSPGSPEFDFLNTTSRLDYTSPNDLGASGIPVTTQDIRAFPVYTVIFTTAHCSSTRLLTFISAPPQ
jgi:hypothetical protein